MKKITYSLIILIILIWAFLNIERLDVGGQQDVINIQTSVYGLTLFAVLSLFSFYPRWKVPFTVFLGSWIFIYLVSKLVVFPKNPLIGGVNTYLTITEMTMMSLVLLATYRVAVDLDNMDETITNITLGDVSERVKTIDRAQDDIKKELVRSRRYQSPLSVMVLDVRSDEPEIKLKETAEDIMRTMVEKYTSNKLIRFLDRELRRTDLVIEKNQDSQIILLLPETNFEKSHVLAQRMLSKIREELDLDVNCGLASFPDQALTFEDLVEKAKLQFWAAEKLISNPGSEKIEEETEKKP